jgi:replicative DNA helicase
MKADAGLIEAGGLGYLEVLATATPALPNMAQYAKVLRDLAFRRDLLRIGKELAEAALEPPVDSPAQAIADFATEALLQAGSDTAKPVLTPYEIAMETVRELEATRGGKAPPGILTGIEKLDREIGCLRGGDLITILAKSGMGKSALMGALALNMARAGVPVIFFSLEMTRNQLVERMVCDLDFDTAEKAMWYSRVRNHRLSDEEFTRFVLGSQRLDNLPLEICDEDGLTMAQISARARAFVAKWGKNADGTPRLGAIIGDYLQIVEPADARDNRERQVARIVRGAKSLGKRTGWPNIWGSQMNEKDEGRSADERRPRGSDARESKAIMNESDLMLSPYRPAVAVENRKPLEAIPGDSAHLTWQSELKAVRNRLELLALKNRHGRRFDLELWCDMGASAIRDEAPYRAKDAPNRRHRICWRTYDRLVGIRGRWSNSGLALLLRHPV